ncbi:hypothetical protein [Chryseobacterium lactis]|uniref:hypothetical protein n=1 Tax=Chryseobacterium lactis TaxID=1241981 RepID=UPI001628A20F|nr:hypothetical protein [Chryseobacterium lactis]
MDTKQQWIALKRHYDFGDIKFNGKELIWTGKLKSSPLGDDYLVRMEYKTKGTPKVFVLEPKILNLPPKKNKLEHVYDHQKQRLCLYYPKLNEWNETKCIAYTIMPWAIEWLYHYEIWLITDGEWKGGGIHDEKK